MGDVLSDFCRVGYPSYVVAKKIAQRPSDVAWRAIDRD